MPQPLGLDTAKLLLWFALEAGSRRHAPEPLGPDTAEPPMRCWQQGGQGTCLNPWGAYTDQRPIRLEQDGCWGTCLNPLGLTPPSCSF